jgi:hypothetical protein
MLHNRGHQHYQHHQADQPNDPAHGIFPAFQTVRCDYTPMQIDR